jgi:DNA helicase-2/ATP-dependent DNA helicase PcrA
MSPPGSFSAQGITPTAEQLAIQTSDEDTLLVHANAGAAKTTSLALRIAEGLARGLPPSSMLALTYTRPAVAALRAALLHIGVAPEVAKQVWIDSFEGFALYCLKAAGETAPPYYEQHQPEALCDTVWAAAEQLRDTLEPHQLAALRLPLHGDMAAVAALVDFSLYAKGSLARETAYRDYDGISRNFADDTGLDYSQLMLLHAFEKLRCPPGHDQPRFRFEGDATYDLARLVSDPDQPDWRHSLPRWKESLSALLVDEMHDLNPAMFAIVQALLRSHPRCYFCGVGDVDQVIHAQAGADAQYLQQSYFDAHTGRAAHALPLTASYRFGPDLAAWAGRLARKPYAARASHATVVQQRSYSDHADCAHQVVQIAQAWKAAAQPMHQLVLLLRHPHQSVLLENALVAADLPYTTQGFGTYLHRPEVLLVRCLLAVGTRNFALVESLETRKRMAEALLDFCQVEMAHTLTESETPRQRQQLALGTVLHDPDSLTIFVESLQTRHTPPHIRRRLRNAIAAVRSQHGQHGQLGPVLDALEMPQWAAEHWVEPQRQADAVAHFDGLRQAATAFSDASAFFLYLNRTELRFEQMRQFSHRKARQAELLLADIPSMKGLERSHVVLPFLERGAFPAPQGRRPQDERNLLYVALTRARHALTLLASADRPSPLVEEMAAKKPA